MTDYRRTEEELWDEDDVAEEDRRTNVLPMFVPGAPGAAGPALELGAAAPEAAGGRSDLASTLRPAEAERSDGSVDMVARFISEPVVADSGAAKVDTPGWSLNALALIANDVLPAEAEEDAKPVSSERPVPPALPPEVNGERAADPLPSMMLGPAMSTRGDVTERVTTIPKTHPLANSIAPGGSAVTVPPRGRRGAQRWHVALGTAALLAVGAGAALFWQSRGEHHAASGATRGERAEPAAEMRVLVEPMEETVIMLEEPLAPVVVESSLQADSAEGEDEQALTAPTIAHEASSAAPPEGSRESAAEGRRLAPPPRSLHVAVGEVQLREPALTGGEPSAIARRPDRTQVIEAVRRIEPELRRCVGDEHGVADVTLTVRSSGAVSHALVEGAFAGSPKGSCIARTLRSAKLPSFGDPVLHIAYSLQL